MFKTKKELKKERAEYAAFMLVEAGVDVKYESQEEIRFDHKGSEVIYFPFSGWATGKSIKDGRGLQRLIDQVKTK